MELRTVQDIENLTLELEKLRREYLDDESDAIKACVDVAERAIDAVGILLREKYAESGGK